MFCGGSHHIILDTKRKTALFSGISMILFTKHLMIFCGATAVSKYDSDLKMTRRVTLID